MAEECAGLEGLDDADSPEDEGVVEPRGQAGQLPRLRLRLYLSRGGHLQQPPRRLQRLVFSTGIVGVGGHRNWIPVPFLPTGIDEEGQSEKETTQVVSPEGQGGEASPRLYAFKANSRNT